MALSIGDYLKRGPASSKEIQAVTGLSQTAVARQTRNIGDDVVKIRSGRSLIYAATCNAFGGNNKLPLTMIDACGNTVLVAHVRPLINGGFFIEPALAMPSLLLGDEGNGLYADLPYFLSDLAPEGFLGRQIAKNMASLSDDFPENPKRWSTKHLGRYLLSNGENLPGNIQFGEQVLLRARRKTVPVADESYPTLADKVMNGEVPASFAGGEQPKFTAFSANSASHVIVKFSPKGENALTQRWRDILLTEYHALETIRAKHLNTAKTRLIEMEGRLFLESQRFDRAGEYGRMSMISLSAIDAEYSGIGSGWPQTLDALYKRGLISKEDLTTVEYLWCFGRLINNTDKHLGNLSFTMEDDMFRLLPLYDMCSMGFAPNSGGEIPNYTFIPPELKLLNLPSTAIDSIKEMAHDFWERVAKDKRISEQFKLFSSQGNPIDLM